MGNSPPSISVPRKNEYESFKLVESSLSSQLSDAHELFNEYSRALSNADSLKIIVTSIGKQSLGKSFLLNTLFNTDFTTKQSVSERKCTKNLNAFDFEDFLLLDLEGIGSDSHTTRRDHINLSLSLAFSHITLMHLKHDNICDDGAFLERFAFSYWLAMKKIKFNSFKRAKIAIILRDPQIDRSITIDKAILKLTNDVTLFCNEVNAKITVYNQRLVKILETDSRIKNKAEMIPSLIPFEEELMFNIEFYESVLWDNINQQYVNVEKINNRANLFDKSVFLGNFDSLKQKCIDEIRQKEQQYAHPSHIPLATPDNDNVAMGELKSILSIITQEISSFFGLGLLRDQMLFEFYLSIEVDAHYFCASYHEFELMIDCLTSIIEEITIKDKKLMSEINSLPVVNVEKYRKIHYETIKSCLDKVQSQGVRDRIIESLVRDSAINYNNYLGLTIAAISNKKVAAYSEISFENMFTHSYAFKSLNPDNIVIFTIECIINFPNNNELIYNELDKISKIRNVFECLSFFEGTMNFYNTKIKPKTQSYIFIVAYCLFNERVKRMFKSELDATGLINFEISKSKLNQIDIRAIEKCMIELAVRLDLPLLNEIHEFISLLDQYYHILTKLIIMSAGTRYLNPVSQYELFFERGHCIMSKSINVHTISGIIALVGGFSVRAASILWAGLEIIAIGMTWAAMVAEAGIAVSVTATGIVGAIIAVPLIGSHYLYKWGKKKLRISSGSLGEFLDKFAVGKEISKNSIIFSIKSEELIKNCSYVQSYPKVKSSPSCASKEMQLERVNKNSLSAFILNYYTVTISAPNDSPRIDSELIKRELRRIIDS